MEGLIHWFSRNHVAANFLMLAVVILGLNTWFQLKKEIFPETATDSFAVTVPYPNASPDEVETGLVLPIEEAIRDVDGIDRVRSTAAENAAAVLVEVKTGYDVRDVMDDAKTRIDAIENLAEEAEEPVIEEILIKRQVLSIAVSADTDEKTLRRIAEDIRDGLLVFERPKVKGEGFFGGIRAGLVNLWRNLTVGTMSITQVELANVRPYEISIEVSEDKLRSHGLTLAQVADAVRRTSLDLPAGSVRTSAGEILIRTAGKRSKGEDYNNIPVVTRPDGSELLLGEIAHEIIDGFEEVDISSRFDGRPAVLVNVYRVGAEDTLEVVAIVRDFLKVAESRLPEGVTLELWNDSSYFLSGRMDLLKKNGILGLLLVFGVLALFLRPTLAALVAIGIPVSFCGAIWMMPVFDISINMITLFAFILVLGIVVDDAIVVGENVYRRMREGEHPRLASWKGTHEVGVVVIFGVITTAVAFTPMLGVSGVSGKIWRNIPWIVIPTLMFSLLQSKLILPSHLACLRPSDPERVKRGFLRFQDKMVSGMEYFANEIYRPVLNAALRIRWVTFTGFVGLLFAIGSFAWFWLPKQFFPEVEADVISAKLTHPKGVPFSTTEASLKQIEDAAWRLNERFKKEGKPIIKHVLNTAGTQPYQTGFAVEGVPTDTHFGEVTIELTDAGDRPFPAKELSAMWRNETGPIPGAVEIAFQSQASGGGNAIDLEISGPDFDQLAAASDYLQEELGKYKGVIDIADNNREGKREMKLRELTPSGKALGLRLGDVGRQLRAGFYGDEALRLQRGRDEVKVMVRYPREERESLENIEQVKIRTGAGDEIPIRDVAGLEMGRGYDVIRRTDNRRTIKITADIDKTVKEANANKVVGQLTEKTLRNLDDKFPGVTWSFEGEQKDQADSVKDIGTGFIFALIAMYVLMAIPLRSYFQPLIIMSAIPFGLVGAILGHIITGTELSIMSMCGIVALAGVVVNDSLVLVDYVNRHRRDGEGVIGAAWEAGVKRFRPIILTSLTTFAGLTPMLLETDLQAKFLIPMAISLSFGILFATLITLLLVPCLYVMQEDIKKLLYREETIDKWEAKLREDAIEAGR